VYLYNQFTCIYITSVRVFI